MNMAVLLKRWGILLLALIVILSCNAPGSTPQTPQTDPGLEETRIAIGVQETSLVLQQTSLALEAEKKAEDEAQKEAEAAREIEKESPLQNLPTKTVQVTQAPPPTDAPQPQLQPTNTSEPVEQAPPADMSDRIKAANVLLYEDMAGNYDRYRLVQRAVNNMRFSGGRVVDLADRDGDFKSELLGTTRWDLIIVSAENRSGIQGEFWGYIQDHLQNDVAVIIEVWHLDEHYTDIAPLFGECGISFQRDWERPVGYDLLNYAIYWLQPYHEFFDVVPNKNVSLGNPNYLYWVPPLTTDAGDLIRLSSGGDAVLLAGTFANEKSSYGTLATCMEGRLIVQTFSTHDYKESEVVNLWEDYMVWTLTNHFIAVDR